MKYRFPPDIQQYVDQMVAKGVYADVEELVVYAVARQREIDSDPKRKYEELKRAIQVGIDDLENGRSAPLDIDVLRRKAMRQVANARKKTARKNRSRT